jgi:hypothetical protein
MPRNLTNTEKQFMDTAIQNNSTPRATEKGHQSLILKHGRKYKKLVDDRGKITRFGTYYYEKLTKNLQIAVSNTIKPHFETEKER